MTGKEILEAEFEKAGLRGYRADQVDALLQSIASFVDKQSAEIKDLTYKVKILADKIEEYKKDEENIRDALLGAQKMGSSILHEAKAKAESLDRQAKATSEELLITAKAKSESMINEAKNTSEDMLAQAKIKIEKITRESLMKANEEISNARKASEKEQRLLEAMKLEVSNFRSMILKQYKEHLDLLSNLPFVDDNKEVEKKDEVKTVNASQSENIKVEEIKNENVEKKSSDDINITNLRTIKSDVKVSDENVDNTLENDEKQQTKEFNKHIDITKDETKEIEKVNNSNSFGFNGQRTSFTAKYGELDFGNHKEK